MRDGSIKEPGRYLLDYPFEGKTYSIEIWAESLDDARARLNAIQNYGIIEGGPAIVIPAVPGAGLLVRLICWWNNWRGA